MKKKTKITAIAVGMILTVLLIGNYSRVNADTEPVPAIDDEWIKQRMELLKDNSWMIKPEYSVIEGKVDPSAFALEDGNLTFTQTQKEQLYNIISSWYEERFERDKGLKLESFEGIPTISFETQLVQCDEKEMILVTFQTPMMPAPRYEGDDGFFKDDTIQTLVYNNDGEYEIYQAWYETEHKYTGVFSSKDFFHKEETN